MSDLYELGLNQFCFPGSESEINSIKKGGAKNLISLGEPYFAMFFFFNNGF